MMVFETAKPFSKNSVSAYATDSKLQVSHDLMVVYLVGFGQMRIQTGLSITRS